MELLGHGACISLPTTLPNCSSTGCTTVPTNICDVSFLTNKNLETWSKYCRMLDYDKLFGGSKSTGQIISTLSCVLQSLFKKHRFRGAWVAQLVKHPTLAQVMISQFVSLSPTSGSVLAAQSLEPASDSVSPLSLCSSPACALSVSVSQ